MGGSRGRRRPTVPRADTPGRPGRAGGAPVKRPLPSARNAEKPRPSGRTKAPTVDSSLPPQSTTAGPKTTSASRSAAAGTGAAWTRRTAPAAPAPRLLAIARRDRPDVYQALRASLETDKLGEESAVSVIWDRRQGPRRTGDAPVVADRRRSDRRAELPPTWATLGFLLASAPAAPVTDRAPIPCPALTGRGRCGLPAEPSRKLRMRPGSAERHYECPTGHRFHRLTGQSGVLPCDCAPPASGPAARSPSSPRSG